MNLEGKCKSSEDSFKIGKTIVLSINEPVIRYNHCTGFDEETYRTINFFVDYLSIQRNSFQIVHTRNRVTFNEDQLHQIKELYEIEQNI